MSKNARAVYLEILLLGLIFSQQPLFSHRVSKICLCVCFLCVRSHLFFDLKFQTRASVKGHTRSAGGNMGWCWCITSCSCPIRYSISTIFKFTRLTKIVYTTFQAKVLRFIGAFYSVFVCFVCCTPSRSTFMSARRACRVISSIIAKQ